MLHNLLHCCSWQRGYIRCEGLYRSPYIVTFTPVNSPHPHLDHIPSSHPLRSPYTTPPTWALHPLGCWPKDWGQLTGGVSGEKLPHGGGATPPLGSTPAQLPLTPRKGWRLKEKERKQALDVVAGRWQGDALS